MNLTDMYDSEWETAYRRTPPGMAHLAGSGPKNRTCRECRFYSFEGRYSANSAKHPPNSLKPGRCGKYKALMKKEGAKFKHSTLACRHFEENPNAPLIQEPYR